MLLTMTIVGCSDEERFTSDQGAKISFSVDTVSFDTVFTTVGSTTKNFQVYNNNKDGVRVRNIRFASNGESGFRMNVDGQYGKSFNDVEILGKDSIFVFVEVTVNPQDSNSPILIQDSILFTLENGNRQQVILQAYGQDVKIIRNMVLTDSTSHFTAERPYVIMDSITVPQGITMTAEPGTTLCFHKGAGIAVHGNLNIQGTTEKPVIFRGDRTDRMFAYLPYDRIDGQWEGIHIYPESMSNSLVNVDIHGGSYGILRDIPMDTIMNTLAIHNAIVHNVAGDGMRLMNCNANISNTQISNTKGDCVNIVGGNVKLTHCTIAQLYPWSATRGNALYFSNVLDSIPCPLNDAQFANCIITGYADDEIFGNRFDGDNASDVPFNFNFDYCLVKTDTTGASDYFKNCVLENADSLSFTSTQFVKVDTENYFYNFELDSLSTARGIGGAKYSILYPTDILGRQRSDSHPSAGCYEYSK